MPHVDHDQKRRPPFAGRQSLGVGFRLPAGFDPRVVPAFGAPDGGSLLLGWLLGGRWGERPGGLLLRPFLVAPLLGFQDKAAPFEEVDAAGGRGAVPLVEGYVSLEDVSIIGGVCRTGVGLGNAEEVAKLRQKLDVVRPFVRAGGFPAVDEGVDVGGGVLGRFHGGASGVADGAGGLGKL